ncbi:hypothetical protein PRZ48_010023 [Zasmidium cellare]|uniref:Uncharacterized protein n=1 Tax=Zasmidium cellare TaxID=395010 RepID=A0ABR0EEK7_ZASCE|nr:hypothetical protein PRZ48_010023 [Zasmidium cellare]
MHSTIAAAAAIGLLGVNVAAQGLGQTAICPFDGNRGPNILLAVVQLPDGGTEIDAWLYGYNWCSHSNFVSSTGDICSDTGSNDNRVEFMHAPFTNKFGAFDPICYANIDIQFFGCEPGQNGGFNYDNVVAWITSKPPDQITGGAIDAAPNFGPQRGQFGQPPQGAIPMSQAGPGQFTGQQGGQQQPQGQVGKRQQSQSQGGQTQSQNQGLNGLQPAQFGQSGNVPGSLNSPQGINPQQQQQPGQFGPQQQGSFAPQQQGQFNPQQQGQFNPQQQGQFNPQQQGQFSPQQQGQFNPQQQGQFNPQQQQQQQQQGQFSPQQQGQSPGPYGGQGQQPGGQQQVSFLYQCVDDREHRGCVYNGQIDPPSETKYTAFLSCGVMAQP